MYNTTASTIPIPTTPFSVVSGTIFLQNSATLTDETCTRTLTSVGSAAGNALNLF